MIDKNYGNTFKLLRTQKGLSLSAFKELGISKTSLYNFEEGHTMMGFDRVNIALNELGYSLSHYENLLNNYEAQYFERIVDDIEKEWIALNIPALKRIKKNAINKGEYIIALVAEGCYSPLSETDKEIITSFLYDLILWDYAELSIFYLSVHNLTQKDILYLFNNLLELHQNILKQAHLKRKITEIILRASSLFIFQNKIASAHYLLNILDSSYFTAYNTNIRNMVLGYYEYKFNNKEKGKEQIDHSLKLIKEIGNETLYEFYTREIKKLL